MDRERRDADKEHHLWANPCDYNNSNSKPSSNQSRELASKLVSQARNAYSSAAKYQDKLANALQSFKSFDELLKNWVTYDWLRSFKWPPKEELGGVEVFPKEKVLNQALPNEYMDDVVKNIDVVLPSMYKGLKMIVAGLFVYTNEGFSNGDESQEELELKDDINSTMHDVRAVLCYFSDIMRARDLYHLVEPVSESDVRKTESPRNTGFLLYRDTLNYLDYLIQVFQKLHDKESA